MAWLAGWSKRIKLSIDQDDIGADLSNFPVLVYLSTSSGRNSTDVSSVFDELQSDANRTKIAVTTSDGVTQCYVEIERWDDANEKAWLWVKVPSVASYQDTDLFLYYDSSQSANISYVGDPNSTPAETVWDDDFVLVSHMRDDPDTSSIRDSTSYSHDGVKKGAGEPVEISDGKIDKAQDFDNSDDYVSVTDTDDLDGVLTLEAWVNPVAEISHATGYHIVVQKHSNYRHGINMRYNVQPNRFIAYFYDGSLSVASWNVPSYDSWYHVVAKYEGGTAKLYVDGILRSTGASISGHSGSNSSPVRIGGGVANRYSNVEVDEVRLSKTERNDHWILASCESGADGLIAFGSEETPSIPQVSVGGSTVIIERGTLRIEERIEERSMASFSVLDLDGSEEFEKGSPVEIYDSTPELIFSGFVYSPEMRRVTGSTLRHEIMCIDNHYLADKRLIVKSYEDKTLEYIVEDILTDYLSDEGVTEGEIQTGPTISSAIFNYVSVAEAFDALKELSGFIWYIDEDKKLYFIDRSTNTAPWNLDGSTYLPIRGSARLVTGNPLYRNIQFVRGGKGLTAQQTENLTGDGTQVAFTVGYPIAQVPSVEVDSVSQTVGIKGLDTGKDCYWNKGDATITFSTAPGDGDDIEVVYYGQYPLIVQSRNSSEILARQAIEGGTGIVEAMVTEARHETDDAMRESAKAKIDQFAQGAEKFTYSTRESGLAPGQLQEITYSPFGFSAHEMLIESIRISSDGDDIVYRVSAITGPSMGSWAKFFAGIFSRQDASIKIGDEYLLALLAEWDSLALTEATDMHTDAFPPDVSRWIALPAAQSEGHHVRHEALSLSAVPTLTSHATEDYDWGDSDAKYGFATWK